MAKCSSILLTTLWLFSLYGSAFSQENGLLAISTAKEGLQLANQPSRFYWHNQPISKGLASLEDAFGISIWLDRRIDPNVRLSYRDGENSSQKSIPLLEAISQAVQPIGAQASLIENVIYVGPKGNGERLQRAAHQLAAEKKLQFVQSLQWSELASYQETIARIAQSGKMRLRGELPHDLLHARALKNPLTLATQLTLLAGGFELECRTRGNFLEVIPLRNEVQIEQTYATSQLQRFDKRQLLELCERFDLPISAVKKQGNQTQIRGPCDFHLALIDSAVANQAQRSGGIKVLTFSVDDQVANNVIMYLAKEIGFRVEWDEAVDESIRNQRISLDFDKATLQEVLAGFAEKLGVKLKFEDDVLRLYPN